MTGLNRYVALVFRTSDTQQHFWAKVKCIWQKLSLGKEGELVKKGKDEVKHVFPRPPGGFSLKTRYLGHRTTLNK